MVRHRCCGGYVCQLLYIFANGSPLTIGKQGIVLVAIEPGMPGRVRVDGLDWQARAEVAIPQGARICVADVDGAVLLVTPVTEATSVE